MEVNLKTKGYIKTVEALVNNAVSDKEAADMLFKSGYSPDVESAERTVMYMHNDISNFQMNKSDR